LDKDMGRKEKRITKENQMMEQNMHYGLLCMLFLDR